MNNDLIITLQNYGFSEKEAKVYLTTLELGNTIASTIARRSEIKRATTYSILNDFKKRGIANEITKDDVKYFSVVSPKILLNIIKEKFEKFESKLPDLLSVSEKFENRSKVQFFENQEAIDFFHSNEDYDGACFVRDIDALMDILNLTIDDIVKKFSVKKEIKKSIMSDSKSARIYKEKVKHVEGGRHKIKFLPKSSSAIVSDSMITKTKYIHMKYKKPTVVIVIEDDVFLETQRIIFDTLRDKLD